MGWGKVNRKVNRSQGIRLIICHSDLPIPVAMDEFSACSENKVQLQQFFSHWLKSTSNNKMQVFLGGCHEGYISECPLLQNGVLQTVNELKFTHEEADQQMQYHINHAMNNSVESV